MLVPFTVARNVPAPLVRIGGTSLKPESFAVNSFGPLPAFATAPVRPTATARTTSARIAQVRRIHTLPSTGGRSGVQDRRAEAAGDSPLFAPPAPPREPASRS